jgi:hypothetical protein
MCGERTPSIFTTCVASAVGVAPLSLSREYVDREPGAGPLMTAVGAA